MNDIMDTLSKNEYLDTGLHKFINKKMGYFDHASKRLSFQPQPTTPDKKRLLHDNIQMMRLKKTAKMNFKKEAKESEQKDMQDLRDKISLIEQSVHDTKVAKQRTMLRSIEEAMAEKRVK